MRWLYRLLILGVIACSATPALAQGEASIRIVQPGDRRNIPMGESTMTVEISGVEARDGHYWQAQVDGVPGNTVSAGNMTTTIDVPKPTGPHHLQAVLFDAKGNELARDDILVIAAPVQERAPVFNREVMARAMGVFVLVVVGIILLGLRLRPRVAA
jgi:hypothetical protein